jgi:thiol-disulfide isomerase/thioredoxin
MKRISWTGIFLLILGIFIASFLYKRYNIPPSIDLPDVALTDMEGHSVSLRSYSGHPLFVDFFATWCGPCMRELPELAALRQKLSGQGLQLVCVCDEPIDKLKPLQARFGDQLIILHSDKRFHDMGIYTYPTNYIFNALGRQVYEKVNPDDWEKPNMVDKVKKLIE